MKYVIIALLCAFSSPAFASGKIIAQGTSYFLDTGHKVKPSVGLSVYEKLGMESVALNSWIGYGQLARESMDAEWLNMSHFIEMYIDKFTFGMGYKFSSDIDLKNVDHGVAVKVAYKLWD